MAFRIATAQDALDYYNVDQGDLLIYGGGSAYHTGLGDYATDSNKTVVLAGTYSLLGLHYDHSAGTGAGGGTAIAPHIITNGQGLVYCTEEIRIKGIRYAKFTGKYDPIAKTGDISVQGHDIGWAYSSGTYGFHVEQNSSIVDKINISVSSFNNAYTSDLEIEYVESSWSSFTNIQLKHENTTDTQGTMYNMKIHDCYFHDSVGEGIYNGSTSPTINQHTIFLELYNNRFCRQGIEGIQVGRLGAGSHIHHNTVLLSATDHLENIFVGGNASIVFGDSGGSFAKNANWSYIRDNYFGFFRDDWVYLNPNDSFSDFKLRFEGNYISDFNFLFDRLDSTRNEPSQYVSLNGVGWAAGATIDFLNNKKGNVKPLFTSLPSFCTESGTTTQTIDRPLFVNSGFNDSTEEWGKHEEWKSVKTQGTPTGAITYPVGYVVYHRPSKSTFECIQAATQIEPTVTTGWASYWTPLTWDAGTKTMPPDDVRLVTGSTYDLLGYGVQSNKVPVFLGAYVNSHNPYEIILQYDDQLDGTTPSGSDFTITGVGRIFTDVLITSSAYNPSFVILTINNTERSGWIDYNESVQIGYTPGVNPLQNANGQCASFSNITIDNRVKDPTPIIDYASVSPSDPNLWIVILNRPCEFSGAGWALNINGSPSTISDLFGYGTGSLFFTTVQSVSYGDVLTIDYDDISGDVIAVQEAHPIAGTPSMLSVSGKNVINKLPNPTPDYTITSANGWHPNLTALPAGATIAVQSGNYSSGLYIGGLSNSTEDNPYKIVNVGGIVSVSSNMSIMQLSGTPSEHFLLSGNNHSGTEYGFQITSNNGQNALELDYCSDYEISGVEIVGSLNAGITARTNVGCSGNWSKFNWFPENIHIHHCKVSNTTYEGFYIGTSHWGYGQTGQPGCTGTELWECEHTGFTRVYNNIAENTGADGLQVGSSVENCEVFNNTVQNFGLGLISGHASGIQINSGTRGLMHSNFISDGPTSIYSYGIFQSGAGFQTIYNNVITRVQTGMIISDNGLPEAFNGGTSQAGPWYRIHNNTIHNCSEDIFAMFSIFADVYAYNNILVDYGGIGPYFRAYNGQAVWTESNNLKTQDVISVVFVDYLNDDYRLDVGSPGKGSAINISEFGIYLIDQGGAQTVVISTNIPPTADAGNDQIIQAPLSSVQLDGSNSSDSDGTIASYSWSQISGPNSSNIVSPNQSITIVNGLIVGVYVLRLTVTDDGGASDSDDVQITVSPQESSVYVGFERNSLLI
jgi:hypothetical protein